MHPTLVQVFWPVIAILVGHKSGSKSGSNYNDSASMKGILILLILIDDYYLNAFLPPKPCEMPLSFHSRCSKHHGTPPLYRN